MLWGILMKDKYKLGIQIHQLCLKVPKFQFFYEELGNEVRFTAGIQETDIICQGYLTHQYYQTFRIKNKQIFEEIDSDMEHVNPKEQVTFSIHSCKDHFHIVQEINHQSKELLFPYDTAPILIRDITNAYKEYKT